MAARFCELCSSSLISCSGEDALSFLHAQLTSDVAALRMFSTQYSGYCSAKGRLLATPLLWRLEDEILLQLPAVLRDAIQSRLMKYVLRARVAVADASRRYTLIGVTGADALSALAAASGRLPRAVHEIASDGSTAVTLLPCDRYLLLIDADRTDTVKAGLSRSAQEDDEALWSQLDIEAGIPVITPPTQEEYVPQMVNLELIGGVSYSKGCYPGQEIVARMHYLGRLKQRMYRLRMRGRLSVGDSLYSAEFGPDQAAGKIIAATAERDGHHQALAVIQTSAVAHGNVLWNSLAGTPVEILPLPYTLPA